MRSSAPLGLLGLAARGKGEGFRTKTCEEEVCCATPLGQKCSALWCAYHNEEVQVDYGTGPWSAMRPAVNTGARGYSY
jgi:hypothetical protein